MLPEVEWRGRRRAHERRVDAWLAPHLERRSLGQSHPVEDFLFTYYSYRPAALRRWHPGVGVLLTGDVSEFAGRPGYDVRDGLARVDPRVDEARRPAIHSIRTLLSATLERPAQLGCFGMHEWAMVYGEPADRVRHASYPLRLGSSGTDEVVERHRISCTHYDAFRFFTAAARPRNVVQPTRQARERLEQPGCLHAAMDCYKWAYKLSPFTSSELVADCFALARDVRTVDMQASPYDLSSLGYEPIRVETAEGKQQYVAAQRGFATRAQELRRRLVAVCDAVLEPTPAQHS